MILLKLFLTFFKIGAFTFGGGYAMLPLMQQEVLANGWLTEEQIINFIAVSESTPGPFAINMATYIGAETAGFLGSVCCTLGVVLPSFIIILLVARFFMAFKDNKWVKAVMSGLKPAVVGLIGAAVVSVALEVFFPSGMSISVFKSFTFWASAVIFGIVMFMQHKKVHPIILILASAALGIISGYLPQIVNL